MAGRLLKLSVIAAAITFGLFWLMQALVGTEGELKEGGLSPTVDFVRLKRDNTPELKKRKLPRKKPPEQPPAPPEMRVAKQLASGDGLADIVPVLDAAFEMEGEAGLGVAGSDRDVVPLVRVEPTYPVRAKQRGIEGWVELEFNINAAGGVTDPEVVASEPGSIFDKAAVNAVRKWKYNPKIDKGIAVVRPSVRVRLAFRMR